MFEYSFLAAYLVCAVCPFIFIRYYALRNEYRLYKDPQVLQKYGPLVRPDLEEYHLIWSFPYYIMFPIRFVFGSAISVVFGFYCIMCSTFVTKESTRAYLMDKPLKMFSRFCMFQSGIKSLEFVQQKQVDYSKYLGPEWEPTFDGASSIISNEQGILDIAFFMYKYNVRPIIDKVTARIFPVAHVGDAIGTIYVDRYNDNRDQRKQVVQTMIKHQAQVADGKQKRPMMVFPEGTTTNGKQIVQFKSGVFIGEYSVKPHVIKYSHAWGENSIFPKISMCQCTISGATSFFLLQCSLLLHTNATILEFPVFEPNEYFWKNHYNPDQLKETRAECYARVVRQIMIDVSGLKDADHINQLARKEFIVEHYQR